MKIFTPALLWVFYGLLMTLFGFIIASSATDDGDAGFLGVALMALGALAVQVGVIAKGIEVGMAAIRDSEASDSDL